VSAKHGTLPLRKVLLQAGVQLVFALVSIAYRILKRWLGGYLGFFCLALCGGKNTNAPPNAMVLVEPNL
jgi:hypothetical protein